MAWESIYPIGAVLLFIGIAWGALQNRRRSPREKKITEMATRELHKHPDRYEQETHDTLKASAKEEQRRHKAG